MTRVSCSEIVDFSIKVLIMIVFINIFINICKKAVYYNLSIWFYKIKLKDFYDILNFYIDVIISYCEYKKKKGSLEFCKQFNARTAQKKGETVPVIITIYADRSFVFEIKTPPVSELIKKKINIEKGSSKPNTDKVGKISWKDIEEIAKEWFSKSLQ